MPRVSMQQGVYFMFVHIIILGSLRIHACFAECRSYRPSRKPISRPLPSHFQPCRDFWWSEYLTAHGIRNPDLDERIEALRNIVPGSQAIQHLHGRRYHWAIQLARITSIHDSSLRSTTDVDEARR